MERDVRARARALRTGRVAVAVGAVLALLYPAMRLPWIFGVAVGISAQDFAVMRAEPFVVLIGVGLGSAGLVGAVLMLGLVQGWGVRFPRWMVGLAGRRVPISLAVVPATLVAVALLAMGRSILIQLVTVDESMLVSSTAHALVFLTMGPWGAALAVATVAYAVRRRAECAVCERGLPEAGPGLGVAPRRVG